MAEERSFIEEEIEEHRDEVRKIMGTCLKTAFPTTRRNVADRFVRDCRTFLRDIDKNPTPFSDDLTDYHHRRTGLESQYLGITGDIA